MAIPIETTDGNPWDGVAFVEIGDDFDGFGGTGTEAAEGEAGTGEHLRVVFTLVFSKIF